MSKVVDADIEDLARAIAKAIGRSGGGGPAVDYSKIGGPDLASKIEGSITNPLMAGLSKIPGAGNEVVASLKQSQSAFMDLSKVGAGFRGDLLGLSIAAANSRMTISEFADVIKRNSESLVGLGGSVTRGAEAFATLSKEFHDSPAADSLKLLGYTSKDLNEVLMVQMGSMRYTQKMDEAGKKQAVESATKLAEQMDEMARLTGKSREEQAAQMKKAQEDAQIEAKMKLIGLKEGPEAEAKARALFTQQYNEAQLRGQGQMFKEVFATGQIMSREAATQAALNSQQAAATRDSALATAKGNESAALAANERARKAAYDDSKDPAKLQMIALGSAGGEASKALGDNMMANRGVTDALKRLELESGGTATNFAELNKRLKENLEQEKAGKDNNNKQVNEIAKTNILFEARMKDAAAGMNEYLLKPLYKLGPGIDQFAKYLQDAQKDFGGSGKGIRPAIAETASGKGKSDDSAEGMFLGALRSASKELNEASKAAGIAIGGIAKEMGNVAKTNFESLAKLGEWSKEFRKDLDETLGKWKTDAGKQTPPTPPEKTGPTIKRNTGSIGMSGKMFEDWGEGTLVELHGIEGVLTQEQMIKLAKGMGSEGAAKAFGGLKGQLDKVKDSGQIDLSKISKDISTSVSGQTVKTEPKVEVKPSTAPSKVEVINWPKELGKIAEAATTKPSEPAKKEEAKATEPKPATQASVRAVDNKIENEPKPATQASVRAVDNALEIPKPDWKSAAGEFGEEMKLPFGSMMDEFGSNFDKVISDVNQSLGDVNIDQFSVNLESINKDLIDALPVIEVSKQQEEFKSKFTEDQKKFIGDFQGMSKENQEFTTFALKRQQDIDSEIIQKHNNIVNDLQKAKNERELTEEEEHQLSESQLIETRYKEQVAQRQEQLDMIKNIDSLADELELERLDQQARKELELMKGANEERLDANHLAMLEANQMFDMLPDYVTEAKDAMMLEMNDIKGDIEDVMSGIEFEPIEISDLVSENDTDYISSAIKDALPFDEMGGVDEATKQQEDMNLFADDMRAGITEVSNDIQDNLGSMIDDAAFAAGPGDASVAGMDFASGPGDASVAGIDYAAPEPVKQALDSTNPFFNDKGEVDLNSINLPGMKKFGADLKSQTAAAGKKDENQSDAETARLQRQAEKKETSSTETKTESKTAAATTKDSTLNDVVKQLSSLNKSIRDLIDQNGKLLGDQIRATKSNNKNNFVGA